MKKCVVRSLNWKDSSEDKYTSQNTLFTRSLICGLFYMTEKNFKYNVKYNEHIVNKVLLYAQS